MDRRLRPRGKRSNGADFRRAVFEASDRAHPAALLLAIWLHDEQERDEDGAALVDRFLRRDPAALTAVRLRSGLRFRHDADIRRAIGELRHAHLTVWPDGDRGRRRVGVR